MSIRLEITEFKKVTGTITFNGLATVNYLVGPNGSGKSSILNAFSGLNDPHTSKKFMRPGSKVRLEFGGSKFQTIFWDETDVNKVSQSGNLKLGILLPNEFPDEKGANGVRRLFFNYKNIEHKVQLDFINETLQFLNLPEIKAERIILNNDPWSNDAGKRIFLQENLSVEANYLASGIKKFNDIRYSVLNALKKTNSQQDNFEILLIILEEPENDLHPKLQKIFPEFIASWLNSLDTKIRERIYFIVSTHSPFIIGSISDSHSHKVYMMDDGMLINLQNNRLNECSGFNGKECVHVVSKMLGADVSDLGYPENYCIIEEYSMQILLDDAKKKGIIKDIQFISASGVSNIVGIANSFDNFKNLNTLLKCDPFYSNKYLVIIDNTSQMASKEKAKLDTLRSKLANRFVELSKFSIEEYYSNLDKGLSDKFDQEIRNKTAFEKGIIKAKYAHHITERMNSKEDFSILFGEELNFLLA